MAPSDEELIVGRDLADTWRRFCLATILAALCSCAGPTANNHEWAAEQRLELLSDRSAVVFETGTLIKPEPSHQEAIGWKLAPLLIVETAAAGLNLAGARNQAAGPLENIEHGALPLVVYTSERELQIDGRWHRQLSYLWRRTGRNADGTVERMQGFRMTLNSAGAPAIWECLPEDDGMRATFVARSLEEAAAREYGPPLPGRRYSIQASALNAPAIVVGGLVEDGPIPMGPIVYVESTTNAISTIHCRCTAAQVRIVSETRVYALRPMEDALESGSWDGGTKETGQDRRWFSTIPRKQGNVAGLRLPKFF